MFRQITGFEQVVTKSIPTYYVVDYSTQRVIQFDQFWNHQKFYGLPYQSWSIKYVNGYFYIPAGKYLNKTDRNFNIIASYNSDANFRSIYYDSSSALFYVTGDTRGVSVFDTSCFRQRLLYVLGYTPLNALSYFNDNLYIDSTNSLILISKTAGVSINSIFYNTLISQYKTVCSTSITSLTIDLDGYMAVGCNNPSFDGTIALYSTNNDATY